MTSPSTTTPVTPVASVGGYIIGAGALVDVVTMPLVGILSDRTRLRRRRPWAIGGGVVGLLGLFVLAVSPFGVAAGIGGW